jgi:hypothetical protein
MILWLARYKFSIPVLLKYPLPLIAQNKVCEAPRGLLLTRSLYHCQRLLYRLMQFFVYLDVSPLVRLQQSEWEEGHICITRCSKLLRL